MEICIYVAIFPICITNDQKMGTILEVSLCITFFYYIRTSLYLYVSSRINQMIIYLPQIRVWTKKMMVIPLEISKQNTKKNQRFIYHNLCYE